MICGISLTHSLFTNNKAISFIEQASDSDGFPHLADTVATVFPLTLPISGRSTLAAQKSEMPADTRWLPTSTMRNCQPHLVQGGSTLVRSVEPYPFQGHATLKGRTTPPVQGALPLQAMGTQTERCKSELRASPQLHPLELEALFMRATRPLKAISLIQ